jgi:hypothetical protein
MTIGDVLAVVAGIMGTGATLWAAILAITVLFPAKSGRAALALEERSARALGTGAAVTLTVGVTAWALAMSPNVGGLPKLIGWVVLLALLLVATLGSAGLAEVGARRLRARDARMRPLASVGKAAGMLVAAGFLPALGWLVLFPLLLMASLGAGLAALRKERTHALANVAVATPGGESLG